MHGLVRVFLPALFGSAPWWVPFRVHAGPEMCIFFKDFGVCARRKSTAYAARSARGLAQSQSA